MRLVWFSVAVPFEALELLKQTSEQLNNPTCDVKPRQVIESRTPLPNKQRVKTRQNNDDMIRKVEQQQDRLLQTLNQKGGYFDF